jgi:hypothetical protein
MEQIEREANDAMSAVPAGGNPSAAAMPASPSTQGAAPQGCPTCGATPAVSAAGQGLPRGIPLPPPWVYAIGNIERARGACLRAPSRRNRLSRRRQGRRKAEEFKAVAAQIAAISPHFG